MGVTPTWLDQHTLTVYTADFHSEDQRALYVIDTESGSHTEIPGWLAPSVVGSKDEVFGVDEGTVWKGIPTSGEMEAVGSIAMPFATPLIVFEGHQAIAVQPPTEAGPRPGTTVPPITSSDGFVDLPEVGGGTSTARIALALVLLAGIGLGLANRRRRIGVPQPPE